MFSPSDNRLGKRAAGTHVAHVLSKWLTCWQIDICLSASCQACHARRQQVGLWGSSCSRGLVARDIEACWSKSCSSLCMWQHSVCEASRGGELLGCGVEHSKHHQEKAQAHTGLYSDQNNWNLPPQGGVNTGATTDYGGTLVETRCALVPFACSSSRD